MERKEIYVVVEVGWDHHINKGVFDDYIMANAYRLILKERDPYYSYEIEDMLLNVCL